MTTHEYSVIPAPKKGVKGRGIKGAEAQFANALAQAMNEAAADGWEYVRAETLPSEERQGLTGKTTVYHNMLVFRRPLKSAEAEAPKAALLLEPEKVEPPAPQPVPQETPKAVEIPKIEEPVFTRSEAHSPSVPTAYTVKVDPGPGQRD